MHLMPETLLYALLGGIVPALIWLYFFELSKLPNQESAWAHPFVERRSCEKMGFSGKTFSVLPEPQFRGAVPRLLGVPTMFATN